MQIVTDMRIKIITKIIVNLKSFCYLLKVTIIIYNCIRLVSYIVIFNKKKLMMVCCEICFECSQSYSNFLKRFYIFSVFTLVDLKVKKEYTRSSTHQGSSPHQLVMNVDVSVITASTEKSNLTRTHAKLIPERNSHTHTHTKTRT